MNSQLVEIIESAKDAWAKEQSNGREKILVSIDTSAIARGAEATLARIREVCAEKKLNVDISITGSTGFCWVEPCVSVRTAAGTRTVLYANVTADRVEEFIQRTIVEGADMPELALGVVDGNATAEVGLLADHPFMKGQVRRLMANTGRTDPCEIDHYLANDGYKGFLKALDMTDEAVIKEMLDSGVGGRGGANFPVGRKWDFLRTATASPKYLVCNADEGDPGAWVNRTLMEGDPHLIIEGLMIAARASGARYAYVYIRYEYPLAIERMQRAVDQAKAKGMLGENILGTGMDFDVIIFKGAGSYVCGDETGLINSIDGYRGMPRIKPPFPAQAGIFNKPTNVNNVESYANAPLILRNGAEWWNNLNPKDQPEKGTKMFSLSGQIKWLGVFEVPFGSGTMRQFLEQYGGGMRDGSVCKGFQPGGPLSGIVPASDLDAACQLGPFRERGMFLGGGGIMFFDQKTSILDLVQWMIGFCEDESCGRCTTCHGGSQRAVEILRRIGVGGGRDSDFEKLDGIVKTLVWSNCQHGQLTPTAIKTALRFFRSEFESLIRDKYDPTGSLPGFQDYVVRNQNDENLPEAAAICPTNAFVEEDGKYAIVDEKCVRCGACKEVSPGGIEILDRFRARRGAAASAAGG